MRPARGVIYVETALVVGVVLQVLLFTIQIGVVGFLQITADAAAFVDAHGHAVGTIDALGPDHAASAIFPQVRPSDMAGVQSPAPVVSTPNNDNIGVSGQRHGGYSMIEPRIYTTTVTPHATIARLGKLMSVVAQDTEPLWVECGVHFDLADSTAPCGSSTQPANYEVPPLANGGENTPPYYVGFNLINRCVLPQPYASCLADNVSFLGLGVGEYLNVSNWGAVNGGASGTGKAMNGQPNSVFEYAACHQRIYSTLANFFPVDLPTLYNSYQAAIRSQLMLPTFAGATGVSDYRNWVEFTTTLGTPSAYDLDIREIYNWDAQVPKNAITNNNSVGTFPLAPGTGC